VELAFVERNFCKMAYVSPLLWARWGCTWIRPVSEFAENLAWSMQSWDALWQAAGFVDACTSATSCIFIPDGNSVAWAENAEQMH